MDATAIEPVFATSASIATCTVRAASDFSVTAVDEITVLANAANNTNNQYIFFILEATYVDALSRDS